LLRALIFDFDGLIADTEGVLADAGRTVFEEHGVAFPFVRWLTAVGTATADDFWIGWLEGELGHPVDHAVVTAEFKRRNTAGIASLKPCDGVVDLLDAADDAGIAVAIASSSSSRWVVPLLAQFGLVDRFAIVVCREDAPRAKPAPDLYLEALRQLDVDACESVALEDSRNGSLAAIAARIFTVVVPNELTVHQDLSHASLQLASLADVDLDVLDARLRVSS
jgi:putative hydrolase of the HAD superfamily